MQLCKARPDQTPRDKENQEPQMGMNEIKNEPQSLHQVMQRNISLNNPIPSSLKQERNPIPKWMEPWSWGWKPSFTASKAKELKESKDTAVVPCQQNWAERVPKNKEPKI